MRKKFQIYHSLPSLSLSLYESAQPLILELFFGCKVNGSTGREHFESLKQWKPNYEIVETSSS